MLVVNWWILILRRLRLLMRRFLPKLSMRRCSILLRDFKAFEGVPAEEEVDELVEQGLKRAGAVLDANIFE
jgi:hypothetical protein